MAISLATCASLTRKAPTIRIPYRIFSLDILKCFAARTLATVDFEDKRFLNSLFLSFQGGPFRQTCLWQVDLHLRIAKYDTMFLRPSTAL